MYKYRSKNASLKNYGPKTSLEYKAQKRKENSKLNEFLGKNQ